MNALTYIEMVGIVRVAKEPVDTQDGCPPHGQGEAFDAAAVALCKCAALRSAPSTL